MDPRDETLLQDLLDDRLEGADAAAVRERLASEPELEEVWDDLLRIRELVRGAPEGREGAPKDFLSRVRARIATEEAEGAQERVRPRLRLLRGRRLGLTAAAVAALVLVAVGVRLFVAAEDEPAGETTVISARATEEARADAIRDEDVEDAPALEEIPEMRESLARTAGRPARPGGFAPGDQVPPGIREPSDPEEGAAPPVRFAGARGASRRARDGAAKSRGFENDVELTLAVTAPGLDEGHARIALLVASLSSAASEPSEVADGFQPAPDADAPEILGSVVVSLPRDALRSLARLEVDPDDPAPVTTPAPVTPAAPAGPDRTPPKPKSADDKLTSHVRVRVLVLRAR